MAGQIAGDALLKVYSNPKHFTRKSSPSISNQLHITSNPWMRTSKAFMSKFPIKEERKKERNMIDVYHSHSSRTRFVLTSMSTVNVIINKPPCILWLYCYDQNLYYPLGEDIGAWCMRPLKLHVLSTLQNESNVVAIDISNNPPWF